MKKYLNLIVGSAAAVLTFIWFALPVLTTSFFSANTYEMINFETGEFKYTLFGICAIALMLVAIAILVLALLKVLKVNIKVNYAKLNRILLIVAAVLAVVCLVLMITQTGNGVGIGISLILTAITYVAAVVCNFVVKED